MENIRIQTHGGHTYIRRDRHAERTNTRRRLYMRGHRHRRHTHEGIWRKYIWGTCARKGHSHGGDIHTEDILSYIRRRHSHWGDIHTEGTYTWEDMDIRMEGHIHRGTYTRRRHIYRRTYVRRGHTRGENLHTERHTHGDIPMRGYTHWGDIHTGDIHGGTYTMRGHHMEDIHMKRDSHGGHTYIRTCTWRTAYGGTYSVHTDEPYTRKGTYTRRDIHPKGHTPEGTYTSRDLHTKGPTYGGEWNIRNEKSSHTYIYDYDNVIHWIHGW